MISRSALAPIIACLIFSAPAAAQERLSRTELTAATNELNASVSELEVRSEALQVQNADLALQVRELEAENAQITGRIETLQFQLGQSRDEVNRLRSDDQEIGRQLAEMAQQIADLETRLARREQVLGVPDGVSSLQGFEGSGDEVFSDGETGAGTVGPNGSSSSGTGSLGTISASNLPGEAGPLFADAKARLLRFDYKGAERSFRAFLEQFGDDEQAGEAQYWLGEVLYQQESYAESGAAYRDMIRDYPEDARAPDALVKLGRSLRLIGDEERACAVLATLPSRYPEASPVTRNLAAVERNRSSCDA